MADPQQYPSMLQQSQLVTKKSNAWKWILAILGTFVVLCGGGFIACSALVAGGVDHVVKTEQSKAAAVATENAISCSEKSYPDQQTDNDRCANDNNNVVFNGIIVTATPLKRTSDSLCTDVSYTNNSDATVSFNEFDWKLQLPTGEILTAWDSVGVDSSLGSGDLIKGGMKTGTLCYQASSAGQHVLIYKPSAWNDTRGIWVNMIFN